MTVLDDLIKDRAVLRQQLAGVSAAIRAEREKGKRDLYKEYNDGKPRKFREPITMSKAARKKISNSQKARWAKKKAA